MKTLLRGLTKHAAVGSQSVANASRLFGATALARHNPESRGHPVEPFRHDGIGNRLWIANGRNYGSKGYAGDRSPPVVVENRVRGSRDMWWRSWDPLRFTDPVSKKLSKTVPDSRRTIGGSVVPEDGAANPTGPDARFFERVVDTTKASVDTTRSDAYAPTKTTVAKKTVKPPTLRQRVRMFAETPTVQQEDVKTGPTAISPRPVESEESHRCFEKYNNDYDDDHEFGEGHRSRADGEPRMTVPETMSGKLYYLGRAEPIEFDLSDGENGLKVIHSRIQKVFSLFAFGDYHFSLKLRDGDGKRGPSDKYVTIAVRIDQDKYNDDPLNAWLMVETSILTVLSCRHMHIDGSLPAAENMRTSTQVLWKKYGKMRELMRRRTDWSDSSLSSKMSATLKIGNVVSVTASFIDDKNDMRTKKRKLPNIIALNCVLFLLFIITHDIFIIILT